MKKQFLFSLIGALISGLILGYILLIYGANNGCFFIEGGYETCGYLGFFLGVVIGGILGLKLFKFYRE